MKTLHKWLGVPVAVVLCYMGLSGILLNHPALIAGLDAPAFLLPSDMRSNNWGRGRVLCWIPLSGDTVLAGGKGGILRMHLPSGVVEPHGAGLPASVYSGTVEALARDEDGTLWAATSKGMFSRSKTDSVWVSGGLDQEVHVLATSPLGLHAFGRSGAWRRSDMGWVRVLSLPEPHPTLVQTVFHLHSGAILGIAGRLLYDVAGLALIALGTGGLYLLVLPRMQKRLSRRARMLGGKLVRYHMVHQRGPGWVLVVVMLIIPATGLFMQPPLSAILSGTRSHAPEIDVVNAAAWDSAHARWILASSRRLWYADSGFNGTPAPATKALPVHPMGITAILPRGDSVLVGSYSGLLRAPFGEGRPADFFTGRVVERASLRAAWQINAIAPLDTGIAVGELRKGWLRISGVATQTVIDVPAARRGEGTYSLWHFLFELHNGRILRSWIGKAYMLHNPLVALGTFLVVASGVVLVLRRRRNRLPGSGTGRV